MTAETGRDPVAGRAARGVRLLAGRNLLGRLVATLGGLAIAGLLGPATFGVFAVGMTIVQALYVFGTGGLGASLVRRPEPPTDREQRALVTFQLLLGLALAALAILATWVALPAAGAESDEARTLALLLAVLPVSAWRVVPACLLEREMRDGAVAVVELSDQLSFYAVAVCLALAGLGLWSLVAGALAAAVVAAAAANVLSRSPGASARSLPALGAIWRFGAKYQLAQMLDVGRDAGLNALLLAFAGAGVTGVWALVQRVLLGPISVFQALWRVGFAAYARVPAAGQAAGYAAKVLSLTALGASAMLGVLVGAMPAVVDVLGRGWEGAVPALALAATGWMVSAPVSAAVLGLLQSRGRLRAPIVTILVQIALLWGAAVALADPFGPAAVGGAWLAALVVDAAIFVRVSRDLVRLPLATVLRALAAGALGAAAGWGLGADGMAGIVLSAAAAGAVWLGAAAVLMRTELADGLALLRRGRLPQPAPVRG